MQIALCRHLAQACRHRCVMDGDEEEGDGEMTMTWGSCRKAGSGIGANILGALRMPWVPT